MPKRPWLACCIPIAAVVALSAGLVTAARPASSAQVPRSYIYVTGVLPKPPAASATIVVEVERHSGTGPHGVAAKLVDTAVARKKVTSGGAFRITVWYSKTIVNAEIHGEATFVVVAFSGKHATLKQGSTQPGFRASAPETAAATHHNLSLGKFRGWKHVPGSADAQVTRLESTCCFIPPCEWSRWGPEKERITRIGEFHLTGDRGLKLKWVYGTEADTTVSVGFSSSPAAGFAADGTVTATNTIGAGSGFSVKGRTRIRYIEGEAYYQRYHRDTHAGCDAAVRYKLTLDHMVGTSWLGKGSPKPNPYGGCLNDPYGKATMHSGGSFTSDRGKAVTISGAATIFGLKFSESTGFTDSVHHDYFNNSRHTHYVCGTTYMPDVPILYSDTI